MVRALTCQTRERRLLRLQTAAGANICWAPNTVRVHKERRGNVVVSPSAPLEGSPGVPMLTYTSCAAGFSPPRLPHASDCKGHNRNGQLVHFASRFVLSMRLAMLFHSDAIFCSCSTVLWSLRLNECRWLRNCFVVAISKYFMHISPKDKEVGIVLD